MKDDFFAGLFEQARKVATEILDKAEQTLRDEEMFTKEETELEKLQAEVEQLRTDNDRLAEVNVQLDELADELTAGIQLLLDGEIRKDITMTWERYWNLRDSNIEIVVTDPANGQVTVTISQER